MCAIPSCEGEHIEIGSARDYCPTRLPHKADLESAILNFFVELHDNNPSCSFKQKRQIFREQVLPALGGKIPEDAFRRDRLALNRLNKEGITIVDGVTLEARHADKHPTHERVQPEVIKVLNY